MTIFPEKIRGNFKHLTFAKRGKCSQYEKIVRQYVMDFSGSYPAMLFKYFDINGYSCLNGWTFGNIISSAHDITMFFYELLGNESILSHESIEMMKNFEKYTTGFPITYGLGLVPAEF